MYKKLKPHKIPEKEREEHMRAIWHKEYCSQIIKTYDNVEVKFYEDMFDHAFYESSSRIKKNKSILSLNRLEKMLWIKDALQDPDAILKQGFDSEKKKYIDNRRVTIVKGNYLVVIMLTGYLKAKFITAFEKNDIENVLGGPDFVKSEKFFGKK